MHLAEDVNPQIPFVVGKAAIAIAWADGAIQPEEITCIKKMLEEAPDIPAGKLEILNDFLQSPIEETEREVIIDELAALLHNREERNFAIYWLDQMTKAKGKPQVQEKEIHDALINRLMGEVARTMPPFSEAIRNRRQDDDDAPAETIDEKLQVWIKLIRDHAPHIEYKDELMKEIVMTGLLLSRIALADNRINEDEAKIISNFFAEHDGLSKRDAQSLTKILLAQDIEDEQDIILISSKLKNVLKEKRIAHLSKILFQIGQTHTGVKEEEINEIISITSALGLNEASFIKNLKEFAGPAQQEG